MTKIVIATSNEKKLAEIKALLCELPIEIIPQSQLGIESCAEPFNTFIENALVKARFAAKQTNLPAMADDSGLCVDSLDGQPGVLSARFSGGNRNDEDNNDKLLSDLKNIENRRAHYYCALVFVKSPSDPQPIVSEGIWQGEILKVRRGYNGFGYDPIFMDYKTDQSAAEISPELKNRISHRGQALQKLKQKLKILYEEKK
ncbi:RdgB/HAM1 family non-canonical purine NTP pyrophosphatase [Methylophilaceae bacterium]|jgi:XTP/dITP diphosphohydrolase|nr:RdgB/HAM1 family non-canonical purine NTP pyrophosphatase [Methylophilaceae bacterium]|tara:strand:- start:81 stop:683 length:603 start_codon:yes stop_codon:yes gene_type:complete